MFNLSKFFSDVCKLGFDDVRSLATKSIGSSQGSFNLMFFLVVEEWVTPDGGDL